MRDKLIKDIKQSNSFKKNIGAGDSITLKLIRNSTIYFNGDEISIDDANFHDCNDDNFCLLIIEYVEFLSSDLFSNGLKTLKEFEIFCYIHNHKIKNNIYDENSFSGTLEKLKNIDKIRETISILYGYSLKAEITKILIKYSIL